MRVRWKVQEVESLWWRHWRWTASYGLGYDYGLAATRQSAIRKAKKALSQLATTHEAE